MIKGIIRFISHALIFLLVCLPMMIAGAILLLFVCLFMPNNRIKLPYIFRFWDIVDGWIGRDTSVIQKIYAEGWWSRYTYCAWRNPVNYFDYFYLGLNWNGSEEYTLYDPAEDDINTGNQQGYRHIEVMQGDKSYYEYCLVWVYPFAKPRCLYFRFGWKIVNKDNPAGSVSQWVLTINPFCTFTGKL